MPWADEADCRFTDPEAFFPAAGEPSYDAKRICASCPVQKPCLEYALRGGRRVLGIWGGLSERQRDDLRRRAS
ncbi:hypothetical protein NIIDNTM18_42780 [Mycolicibacterium litorale]|uniref:Transcriptional regulator WhiB n=1 Tax=Mycolicibacterium litorale TaxID=758802 RepID=A0A6S6PEB8_9MYCO|nr:WhiB family transcriptional regulator [Mycolicibacterium litorale]BCI55000.1 hypothetical protein NIIDNTM18_42780 [Mycolicibacterium litorale]